MLLGLISAACSVPGPGRRSRCSNWLVQTILGGAAGQSGAHFLRCEGCGSQQAQPVCGFVHFVDFLEDFTLMTEGQSPGISVCLTPDMTGAAAAVTSCGHNRQCQPCALPSDHRDGGVAYTSLCSCELLTGVCPVSAPSHPVPSASGSRFKAGPFQDNCR